MRERLRGGDREALGELYDAHAQVLYRYALRVTGDWAEAEDIVSATFLEAWRSRERLRPEGAERTEFGERTKGAARPGADGRPGDGLRPWLLGIATNLMRQGARARRRRDLALARLPERGSVPDFADEVVTHLADTEQLRAAHVALGRLRRRDREVFTLVVWAGLDYAAAAEALGVPVGTVRSRLSRARTRLRAFAAAETARSARDRSTTPHRSAAGCSRAVRPEPKESHG
ncbi:RNA polymerase sigma factor [Streptomyces sp. NPDC014870]|uniref:RNA polymerase sigma factor n=1 Tax=Streptomyces sp. NPDC014870 TaxID=3364925 RepID=UPI0036F89856